MSIRISIRADPHLQRQALPLPGGPAAGDGLQRGRRGAAPAGGTAAPLLSAPNTPNTGKKRRTPGQASAALMSRAFEEGPAEGRSRSGCSAVEAVARPPDRLDDLGVGGVVLDLLPYPADVDGDSGAVPHIVIAPDLLEELLFGKDDIGVLGQELQEGELPVGTSSAPARLAHLPAPGKDPHVPYGDDLLGRAPLSSTGEAGVAAQVGLHPGHQLGRVEGLAM